MSKPGLIQSPFQPPVTQRPRGALPGNLKANLCSLAHGLLTLARPAGTCESTANWPCAETPETHRAGQWICMRPSWQRDLQPPPVLRRTAQERVISVYLDRLGSRRARGRACASLVTHVTRVQRHCHRPPPRPRPNMLSLPCLVKQR